MHLPIALLRVSVHGTPRREQTPQPTSALLKLPPLEREEYSYTSLTFLMKKCKNGFPCTHIPVIFMVQWIQSRSLKPKIYRLKYVSLTSYPLNIRLCAASLGKRVLHVLLFLTGKNSNTRLTEWPQSRLHVQNRAMFLLALWTCPWRFVFDTTSLLNF